MPDEDTAQSIPAASEPAQPVNEPTPAPTSPMEQTAQSETSTAQTTVSEPLPPEPEPITSAQTPPASQPTPPPSNFARDLLAKARATIQFRKTAKLEKIMTELGKKNKIANDEVEKLLHVSDATATRYLSKLEKGGKIKQVGKTGKAVEYTHI